MRLAIGGGAAAALAIAATLLAMRGRDDAPPPTTPAPPPEPGPQLLPDGTYALHLPNLDTFDPIAAFPDLRTRVAKFAGVEIYPHSVQIHDPDPTGHLRPQGVATYGFLAPGFQADGERYCLIEVVVEHTRANLRLGNFAEGKCEDRPVIQPPRCTFSQLRQKALAKGLDPSSTSTIHLQRMGGRSWLIATVDDRFEAAVDDDCP
jgi:hypothetical protein